MHYTLIQEFEGKTVEVTTVKREFTGTLKYDLHKGVLVVTPTDKWVASRFGPAFVDVSTVVAIREVFPRPDKKGACEDNCDCDESKG